MAVLTLNATDSNDWITAFHTAVDGTEGWSGVALGSTVVGSIAASTAAVVRCDHPTYPFYVLAYSTDSSTSPRVFIAEDYNLATGEWLHNSSNYSRNTSAGTVAPNATSAYSGTAYRSTLQSTLVAAPVTPTGTSPPSTVYLTDSMITIGDFAALIFDTAVADPTADPYPVAGLYLGTSVVFCPTRMPGLATAPSSVVWHTSQQVTGWVSPILTSGPDAYNTANSSAYNFTPMAFRHGTPVGGQLRGSTKNFLVCDAGAAGEEILIPGEGLYRKLPSGFWVQAAGGV